MIAATAHAFVIGKKVAGIYDHTTGRHLRVAAESRETHLQGYDGDRNIRFGGSLPEIGEAGATDQVHMVVTESKVRGYDRNSSGHFTAEIAERAVQIYDYADKRWFAYNVQIA